VASKTKLGRPADPVFRSKGSKAFAAWSGTIGHAEAADYLSTSRQTVWRWAVADSRPSPSFQEQIEAVVGIPAADWRNPA